MTVTTPEEQAEDDGFAADRRPSPAAKDVMFHSTEEKRARERILKQ